MTVKKIGMKICRQDSSFPQLDEQKLMIRKNLYSEFSHDICQELIIQLGTAYLDEY